MKTIYWIDGFSDGIAKGGFYIFAKSLPKFLIELKEQGLRPVGIEFNDEDEKLVNVILEINDAYREKYPEEVEDGIRATT